MDVSSSTPACPHRSRPSKKPRLSIEIAAGFGLAVLCIAAVAWRSHWADEAARSSVTSLAPPETVIARPYRELTQNLDAFIGYNRTLYLFRVENRDAFPWAHCLLSLNSHGISGYDLEIALIKPGLTEAALLQSTEVLDAEGKNFDPYTDRIATLDLDCETPDGHRYYRGAFGPKNSVGR